MMPGMRSESQICRGSRVHCLGGRKVSEYWGNVFKCGKSGFTVNRGAVNRGFTVVPVLIYGHNEIIANCEENNELPGSKPQYLSDALSE